MFGCLVAERVRAVHANPDVPPDRPPDPKTLVSRSVLFLFISNKILTAYLGCYLEGFHRRFCPPTAERVRAVHVSSGGTSDQPLAQRRFTYLGQILSYSSQIKY
jgi:hypothetical protein